MVQAICWSSISGVILDRCPRSRGWQPPVAHRSNRNHWCDTRPYLAMFGHECSSRYKVAKVLFQSAFTVHWVLIANPKSLSVSEGRRSFQPPRWLLGLCPCDPEVHRTIRSPRAPRFGDSQKICRMDEQTFVAKRASEFVVPKRQRVGFSKSSHRDVMRLTLSYSTNGTDPRKGIFQALRRFECESFSTTARANALIALAHPPRMPTTERSASTRCSARGNR
jgi:hypothetical protein